ncbi:MAG: hypothetical protein WA867_16685, partial [Candidatus Acidiferrales bacterium]
MFDEVGKSLSGVPRRSTSDLRPRPGLRGSVDRIQVLVSEFRLDHLTKAREAGVYRGKFFATLLAVNIAVHEYPTLPLLVYLPILHRRYSVAKILETIPVIRSCACACVGVAYQLVLDTLTWP